MNKAVLAFVVVAATGCGTLFNKNPQTYHLAPGASVNGTTGPATVELDQRETHVVTGADGSTCTLRPGISAGYFVLDLFLTGPIGIIIDAVTGDWKVLKGC